MIVIISQTAQVTAILTDDGVDQIIPMAETGAAAIIRRECRDLRALGCNVKTKLFANETDAYAWADARF